MAGVDPERVKRVLIYRLGSLGDTVVALPALHRVAHTFPNAKRLMLTNLPVHVKAPASSAVIGESGLVHGYIGYPVGTRSPAKLFSIWWKIRRFRPDILIYLAPSRGEQALERDRRFFRLCGVSRMVGIPTGDLARPKQDAATGIFEHESARLLRTIRPLGEADALDLRNWDLHLTEAERRKAKEGLAPLAGRRFIACGPGTKMQAKDWGGENWRALLARLSTIWPEHAMVMVGAREDAQVSDYAATDWAGPKLNLCGALTPRETGAVLDEGAELFLGPDSGPMHMAAGLGIPCAIVYASRSRKGHWFPIGDGHEVAYHTLPCSLCNLEVCIENKKQCITSISVEEMLEGSVKAWEYGQTRRAERAV
ncbi:glycosyltransferase family 9 protein [Acidipila sp. 4G-K13]|uniref:Glycosyltransferase family 9 protein n=1 Tax=Paracidobacterium acidisoli TaxID=2303751 RepID=A0A372ISP4_9BACT|nr:glycosyltransferase family 9 protein [Paracidobacterium acidisoli]